mgnify:CR=1 FL=1
MEVESKEKKNINKQNNNIKNNNIKNNNNNKQNIKDKTQSINIDKEEHKNNEIVSDKKDNKINIDSNKNVSSNTKKKKKKKKQNNINKEIVSNNILNKDITKEEKIEDNKVEEDNKENITLDKENIILEQEDALIEENNIKEELTREIPVVKREEVAEYLKNKQTRNLTINDKYNYEDFEDNDIDININKKKNNILTIIISSILLLLIILSYLSIPKIKLIGDKEINLSYKDEYKEDGYIVKNIGKDYNKEVNINNNIEEHKVGEYQVEYSIKYLFFNIKKIRKVNIIDKDKPIIRVDNNPIKICPLDNLEEIEYYSYDEYDGDITSSVIVMEDKDYVTFKVKDSSLNEDILKVKLIRIDEDKPVINLKGDSVIYLYGNTKYQEPGYSAEDNCDGDITDKVVVSGEVLDDIGEYTINYTVVDSSNNKSVITRKVIRKNNSIPSNNGYINNGEIYLTFDDGPSEDTTGYILDVLKEEGVKATFFVTCNGPDYLIKRMYDEGHTVALHTASHNYSYVYSSVDNYFNDLEKVRNRVKNITGYDSKIIRFPGGSSNTISRSYQYGIMSQLTNMVIEKGYRYYDWNVDADDAGHAYSSSQVYNNVVNHLSYNRANMVLMHDIKYQTKDAIRDIIRYGKNNGYTFKKIENDTYMIRHGVNN